MRAVECRLQFDPDSPGTVVTVKVPESGTLLDALEIAEQAAISPSHMFSPKNRPRGLEYYVRRRVDDLLGRDAILRRRVARFVSGMSKEYGSEFRQEIDVLFKDPHGSRQNGDGPVSHHLVDLIPKRILRELQREALYDAISERSSIMIDMPDYPKHDRRLIARDLDAVQGLWNRLMSAGSNVSLVVFLQKETFNYADHFLYGKMDIIPLMPLSVDQLLEAYAQKWGGYEPFNKYTLQLIAKMSRGVFRRFKRYIALAVEIWMSEGEPQGPIGWELAKRAVPDEEIMRDMDKDLEGIFKKADQKQKALDLIKLLSGVEGGINQKNIAGDLHIDEMAASRLVRELEQHGYVKRTSRPIPVFGGEEKIIQINR
jgi:hypothetical protein